MKITIYHGSEQIIKHPDVNKSKSHNDYGKGFYCTQDLELAKEWACGNTQSGFANEYILSDDGLSILDLNSREYSILNWLAVLTKHRTYWQRGSISEEAKKYLQDHFNIDVSAYDVIRGYRADDSYFTFAQDFVSGAIPLRTLQQAMHLGELGEQIILKSPAAFESIEYVRSHPADCDEFYPLKSARDLSARRAYRNARSSISAADDIFMLDIMREGMRHGDPRLQ